jgi:hypothetical protein
MTMAGDPCLGFLDMGFPLRRRTSGLKCLQASRDVRRAELKQNVESENDHRGSSRNLGGRSQPSLPWREWLALSRDHFGECARGVARTFGPHSVTLLTRSRFASRTKNLGSNLAFCDPRDQRPTSYERYAPFVCSGDVISGVQWDRLMAVSAMPRLAQWHEMRFAGAILVYTGSALCRRTR